MLTAGPQRPTAFGHLCKRPFVNTLSICKTGGEIAYIAAPIALDQVLARLQREIRSNETPVVVGLTSP
jgi:hypothetical protein